MNPELAAKLERRRRSMGEASSPADALPPPSADPPPPPPPSTTTTTTTATTASTNRPPARPAPTAAKPTPPRPAPAAPLPSATPASRPSQPQRGAQVPPPRQQRKRVVVASFPYAAQNGDEMDMAQGDRIEVIGNALDEGWYIGKNLVTQRQGVFPMAYTKEEDVVEKQAPIVSKPPPPPPLAPAPAARPIGTSSSPRKVRALHAYEPSNRDELEFDAGDIIEVLEPTPDAHWFVGRNINSGNCGAFPDTLTAPLESPSPARTVPPPPPAPVANKQPPPPPPVANKQPPPPPPPPASNKPKPAPPQRSTSLRASPMPANAPPPPPPPASKGGVAQTLKYTRPRAYPGSAPPGPPPSEYYDAKTDQYSGGLSVSSNGRLEERVETYRIKRFDRSRVTVEIFQRSDSGEAIFTVAINPFVPLREEDLEESSRTYGKKIVAFCEKSLGTFVGRGECWDLGDQALKYADCEHAISSNFGQPIPPERVRPGDILQFTRAVFKYPTGETKSAGAPDHTAVVIAPPDPEGNITVIEQNPQPASKGSYNLRYMTGGEVIAYRVIFPVLF